MLWLSDPQKKIRRILIKIGHGRASEINLASLMELLNEQPSAVPEVICVLAGILKSENTKAYSSAIMVLNIVAERDLELVVGSLAAIMGCIQRGQKELHEDWILCSLDILLKISQKYPDRMDIAVSDLLMCLENISPMVREKSYFVLALLAIMRPGIFSGHSKELVRVLNGLNTDERVYACKIIKKIAERDLKAVEDTYDVLEDLRLNHPNSDLRSEAAYAVEKLKVKENITEQKQSKSAVEPTEEDKGLVEADKISIVKWEKIEAGYLTKDGYSASDISFSQFANLIVPNEKDIIDILKGLGLNHLIKKE